MATKISKDNIQNTTITSDQIANETIVSNKIQNSTIVNADVSPSAAIAVSKVDGAVTSSQLNTIKDNVGLLGFKMAVNEGLTVFNFVDGIVDEFNDESGVDIPESSTLRLHPDDDYYINSNTPDHTPTSQPISFSGGFTTETVTEPDTSTAGTNTDQGEGTAGVYTVPQGMTSVTAYLWGAGSGGLSGWHGTSNGAGGGFTEGDLAVTATQSIGVYVGEGTEGFGEAPSQPAPLDQNHEGGGGGMWGAFTSPEENSEKGGGTGASQGASGAGGCFLFNETEGTMTSSEVPNMFFAAGGAGGSAAAGPGGGGGGTSGQSRGGGGGSQTGGGSGGSGNKSGYAGSLFKGGQSQDMPYPQNGAGGGGGYYGGGSSGHQQGSPGGGGGGSGYVGHPQVSSATTTASTGTEGAGANAPLYVATTNEGGSNTGETQGAGYATDGEDGYILITGTGANPVPAVAGSSTIVSGNFTAQSAPSSARIVVFEEDVDTPTLNTDIIASVSRDGTNFSNATLSDSGYVTGTSGQRILVGTADVSGQPSGTTMRYKIALANNAVKIHGVSLQWS